MKIKVTERENEEGKCVMEGDNTSDLSEHNTEIG